MLFLKESESKIWLAYAKVMPSELGSPRQQRLSQANNKVPFTVWNQADVFVLLLWDGVK